MRMIMHNDYVLFSNEIKVDKITDSVVWCIYIACKISMMESFNVLLSTEIYGWILRNSEKTRSVKIT